MKCALPLLPPSQPFPFLSPLPLLPVPLPFPLSFPPSPPVPPCMRQVILLSQGLMMYEGPVSELVPWFTGPALGYR